MIRLSGCDVQSGLLCQLKAPGSSRRAVYYSCGRRRAASCPGRPSRSTSPCCCRSALVVTLALQWKNPPAPHYTHTHTHTHCLHGTAAGRRLKLTPWFRSILNVEIQHQRNLPCETLDTVLHNCVSASPQEVKETTLPSSNPSEC